MGTQTFVETLTVVRCASCGVPFGMTSDLHHRRREDHKTFWCPAGHSNFFGGKSDTEQARERAEQAERQAKFARDDARFWRDRAGDSARSAAAHKGHVTRIRNLVARGICPVPGCRRNFANIREHMTTEHPDYHQHEDKS